jgi:tetratricopeptide (TPR) repeat protein
MTTQQDIRNVDLARLTALYESGDYTQALETIHAWEVPSLLEEQSDAPGHASLALLVANIYREMARYDKADEYYLQALAGLKHTLGPDHTGYARGLVELGTRYELQGRYFKASEFFEKARDIHEAAAPPDPVAHSRSLQALAGLHDILGKRREAKAGLVRARALMEGAGASPVETADLLLKEAWVLCRLDNLHAVVSRARQALAIYREHKGERHPGTLQAVYRLGRLLIPLWHLDEAATLLEGLVAVRCEMLGAEHPLHAAALESLALLRLAQGEPDEAENLARRSLALTTAALGEQHLDVAARHRTLAHVLKAGNRLPAAAESYEQALVIVRDVLGEEHPQAAETQFDLAEIHVEMGEHREAVERIRAALDRLDQSPEDVRYEQATGCLSLARLRTSAGALDEAGALARRADSLAEQLGGDPLLSGPALLLDARLRVERGGVAEAGNLIDRVEQALASLPPHHPLRMQAVMTRAGLARLAGDLGRAVRLARETAGRVEQSGGERSPWLTAALHFLAEQLHLSGDFAESERVYERTLDLQRRRHGPQHPDLAVTLRGLAQLHLSRGNLAAAEVRFREAQDIRRGCLGDRHPDTAESLNDLAWLLYQAGNLIHGEALFRNALEVRRECLNAAHADTLASQHGLALVALARGAPAEAAELLEQALALIGDDHPQKLPLMHTLARACYTQGNRARALTLLRQVLLAQEKRFGENHDGLVPVLADLVQVHTGLGDHLVARALLERIRTIRAHSPVPDPIAQVFDLVSLSDSHRQLGDLARAGDLARQALDMARRHLKQDDPGLVGYLTHFARTCQAQRAFSAARRHFQEALALVRKTGGDRHPLVAGLWTDLAGLEISHGKPRQATPLYNQAAELLQTVLGEDHPDHAVARRVLGQHLQSLGDYAGAEEALRRHLNIVLRTYGTEHPAVALAYQAMSELQRHRGDLASATASCRQALDLVRRADVPLDALHANLLHALAVLRRQQGQLGEAADLLSHALEIDRTSTGEEGVGHLDSLHELALIEAARGENASALKRLHQVRSLQDELMAAFAYLPPGQVRDAFLALPWRVTESLLTLALRLPDAAEPALAGVLCWKGLKAADFLPGDRVALRQRDPDHARELDRLFDLSVQIASRLLRGAGPEGPQMHHDLLHRWAVEQQQLEGQLAGAVPALARLHALLAVDLPGLRCALPADATYVELVRFRPRDFAEVCAGRDGLLPPRYLGFVLHAGEERVVMCDLGRAADVEGCGGAEALRVALAPHLGGRRQLFVATAGRMGRASCVRLGGPQALVRMLSSGREIVSPLLARPTDWLAWLRDWLAARTRRPRTPRHAG